jgi:hypothetical protein
MGTFKTPSRVRNLPRSRTQSSRAPSSELELRPANPLGSYTQWCQVPSDKMSNEKTLINAIPYPCATTGEPPLKMVDVASRGYRKNIWWVRVSSRYSEGMDMKFGHLDSLMAGAYKGAAVSYLPNQ